MYFQATCYSKNVNFLSYQTKKLEIIFNGRTCPNYQLMQKIISSVYLNFIFSRDKKVSHENYNLKLAWRFTVYLNCLCGATSDHSGIVVTSVLLEIISTRVGKADVKLTNANRTMIDNKQVQLNLILEFFCWLFIKTQWKFDWLWCKSWINWSFYS